MTTEFQWSDAWILLAVVYVGKEKLAGLSEVIGAADYMQRFIGAPAWSPVHKPQDANHGISHPSLTSENFDMAVQEYLSRMKTGK
jgi:hypothetical protein